MKMKTLLTLCGLLLAQLLPGQSTIGTEFWLGYMENLDLAFNDPPVFTLYVDAAQTTTVTVEVPQTGLVLNFTATAGTTTDYTLPSAIWYTENSEVIDNKGIKVTADAPIQLYAFHYRAYFSESTLVLPITELDTDYWLPCFYDDYGSNSPSSFVIVSTADDNEIEITPSNFTLGLHPAGVPFTVTLDAGQNYPVQAIGDLTGSRVRSLSDQPIAIFSGAQEANVELCAANSHLYDQAIPNSLWGTEYYFVPLRGQGGDVVKILAQEDGTQVYFNCALETTLDAGEFYRVELSAPTVINAQLPITVAQFNSSQECNPSGVGDPNMLQLVSTDHQGFSSRFVSPSETNGLGNAYFSDHFANVVTATADVAAIQLDGASIASEFTPFPNNIDFSYAQLEVGRGQHHLQSTAPFYAYAYGFGDYDAYTHNLGYSAEVPVELLCLEIQTDGVYCVDSLIQFTALSNQAIVGYSWDFGNT
ncbi:MAG: IgGFc-binding protein, partial [Phaeodactylibacter sp.]|nr:IgGFc-binding protein [Phaeodactylibacter sp.]